MLTDITCAPGTWQPPTYQGLLDKSWTTEFEKADTLRKRDIANMWCWRFEVETKEDINGLQLRTVSVATRWLRQIKPYVTLVQNENVSPFCVMPRSISSHLSGVPKNSVDKLKQHFDTLCFGDAEARVKSIHKVAQAMGIFTKKDLRIWNVLFVAAQNAAWDAINEHEHTEEDIATAIKLSVSGGGYERPCDSRAIAWVKMANTHDKLSEKQANKHLSVIHKMPVKTVMDGLLFLCRKTRNAHMDDNGYFTYRHHLVSAQVEKPHLYDALVHFVPKHTGWWRTAQALGLPVDDAVSKLLSSKEVQTIVEVPRDLVY